MNDELKHYGVPGMKWGVIRNARLLNRHRRNAQIKQVKNKYKQGKISAEKLRSEISRIKKQKNQELKSTRDKIKNIKNDAEYNKMKYEISKKLIKEVPHHKIKKGAATANALLGALHVGQISATSLLLTGIGLTAGGPAGASVVAGSLLGGAIGTSIEIGAHALVQLGIDKVS